MHRSNVREFPPRIPRIDSCRKSVHYNTPEQNSTAKHHQFIKKVSVQARFTSISIQLSYKQFTLCCSPTSLIKTSSKTVWIRAHDRSRCMKSSGRFSRVIVWLHPRLCRQTNHITYIIQKNNCILCPGNSWKTKFYQMPASNVKVSMRLQFLKRKGLKL